MNAPLSPALGLPTGALPRNIELLRRVLARTKRDSKTGCLLWLGARQTASVKNGKVVPRNQRGYGVVSVKGRAVLVHRFLWEWVNGPIPTGKLLDHRFECPRHCCDPEHLEPVSTLVNTLRGRLGRKWRAQQRTDELSNRPPEEWELARVAA